MKLPTSPVNIDILIGKNLRRIRSEMGWTQEQMANCIQVAIPRISAYESGKEGIGKDIMARICNALGVRPHELFLDDDILVPRGPLEINHMYEFREAGQLNIAEDVAQYNRFRIEEAKKKNEVEGSSARKRISRRAHKEG
jgi:transcriptional regulator with XRE-family HTH domain